MDPLNRSRAARACRVALHPALPALAAALLAAACSKSPEPEAIETAGQAAVSAAITPEAAAAVTAGMEPSIAWRKLATEAEVAQAFDEAKGKGQPVFVYWGAVWCPPCNQVKATIFNRPDFIEKSRAFVPVYLDGDLPGAQKLGARFKVTGYPTMILFRPDGSELTRLPGEVDAQKYLQVLSLGLGAVRPVKEVLAQAQRAPARLGAEDWRLLAYYSWDTDEQQLVPEGQRAALLQRLASACPAAQAEARTRLQLKSLVALAEEDKAATRKRAAAGTRELLLTVLADDALARENLDIVTNYARELTGLLSAPGSPEREQLASVWAATLDRLTADTRLSQGDRIGALISRVALAKISAGDAADAALSPVLLEHVRTQVARADREVASSDERQSVIPSAAYALAQAGLLDDSDRLLEAELKRSHSPYYAMLSLASNAKKRGDKDKALGWYERAYRESKGPATRVQWGASYVNALLELAPQDEQRIAAAASSVLGELEDQTDAFYERNIASLQRMSGKLLAWGKDPAHAPVLGSLRAQRDSLCAALPAADPQRAPCESLLQAGGRKPAPKT